MYKLFKLLSLMIIITIFSGCVKENTYKHSIKDLENIKQKPTLYAKKIQQISHKSKKEFIKEYKKYYFYPWHINRFSVSYKNATWGNMYAKMDVYSENLTPISKKWFKAIIDESNFRKFNTLRKKAITINSSHIRVFPTVSKIFYDPQKAGEGFPFDYNENSSIKINTPLFVSHLSKNKLWAYIESSVAIGWIKVSDIAYVNKKFRRTFENNNYYISIKDDTNIYKNGYLLKSVSLGTLFPKAKKGFIIASKDYKNNAFIRVIDRNKNLKKLGLEFNLENITKISNELIGERYGWGGLLENRDCSLMTKDFYAPFGIFLNRNSGMQKNNGHSIDISKMDDIQKKEFILNNAVPFQTLIYLPGHIMIYIGAKENEPLVFHNVWGVKTIDKNGKEGRSVIGKAVVTTLSFGKELENYSQEYSLLSRIEAITMITSI